jgi:DNA repair protein RecN (Recombination protein N)
LNAELRKLNAEIWRTGRDLSVERRKIIPKLAKAVMRLLSDLGFSQSHFDVAMKTLAQGQPEEPASALPGNGLDTVEFQFAPNPGEPARPLRAIASSGEIARVMLALKTALAAEDEIPVLVFDEVDANVGGETARAVGEKMRQIGQQRQVLCITHLAPVAACASAHYVVTKSVRDGRTVTEIQPIEKRARVEELARMLGGQSDAAIRHAEVLLKSSNE